MYCKYSTPGNPTKAAKAAALATSLAAPTAATDAATSASMVTEDANDADYIEADHRRPKPNTRRHSTDDEDLNYEATPRTAPPTQSRVLPLGNDAVVPLNIDLYIRNANAPHKEDSNKTGRNPSKLNKKLHLNEVKVYFLRNQWQKPLG